jgi:hypothetical protein
VLLRHQTGCLQSPAGCCCAGICTSARPRVQPRPHLLPGR